MPEQPLAADDLDRINFDFPPGPPAADPLLHDVQTFRDP